MIRKKNLWLSIILIALILIADQALKIWIKTHLMLGDEIRITDWFILHFTENSGMAFGMKLGGYYGKLFLSLFRMLAIGILIWYLIQSISKSSTIFIACLSLILAGAIGNLLDSAFYGLIFNDSLGNVAVLFPEGGGYASFLHGRVVDMFYFPLINSHFPDWMPFLANKQFVFFKPVFNIADASITTGVLMLIVFYKKAFPPDKN